GTGPAEAGPSPSVRQPGAADGDAAEQFAGSLHIRGGLLRGMSWSVLVPVFPIVAGEPEMSMTFSRTVLLSILVVRSWSVRAAHAAQRSKRPGRSAAYSAALRARLGLTFAKIERTSLSRRGTGRLRRIDQFHPHHATVDRVGHIRPAI